MQIHGKEYELAKPEEISVKQAKMLLSLSSAYDAFVAADEKTEGERYNTLKALWSKTVVELVRNADEKLKNFDNITVAIFTEVIRGFFPSSSEVKK